MKEGKEAKEGKEVEEVKEVKKTAQVTVLEPEAYAEKKQAARVPWKLRASGRRTYKDMRIYQGRSFFNPFFLLLDSLPFWF